MTPVARQRCGSMREATAWVLANLAELVAGGEVGIEYVCDAQGVEVRVERVSDLALQMRNGPAKGKRAA